MAGEEVVIIGAGPAGLAAAIQLKRYGLEPILLEKGAVGGLLVNANLVENYPGFPGGIPGGELKGLFEEQAKGIGVKVTTGEVTRLDFEEGEFLIQTKKKEYQARAVVIATGTRARKFTEPAIPEEVRDRVFYEVHPLLEARGKEVVIVGAGDAAFDYALNLAKRNEVRLLNRGKEKKCLPLLWERAEATEAIRYFENSAIEHIQRGDGGRLQFKCKSPEGEVEFAADYLIGALGREPKLDFLAKRVREQAMQLEQEGQLYSIGDVKNGNYRQTSIAVGDGVKAAMQIYERLTEKSQ